MGMGRQLEAGYMYLLIGLFGASMSPKVPVIRRSRQA